jgi:hypothetical protein
MMASGGSGEGGFRGLGIFLSSSQPTRSFSTVGSLINTFDQASSFLPLF